MNTSEVTKKIEDIRKSLEEIDSDISKNDASPKLTEAFAELSRLSQRLHRKLRETQKPTKLKSTGSNPVLAELQERLALVRDRVLGVALHGQSGFYLYGRPGTAKTHTVRTTLERLGVQHEYHNGHLTPPGLFEVLESNPNSIIVLDDVAQIFKQPVAKNLLLAALGNQPNGVRVVCYKRKGANIRVQFTGGIIAISNLELHGGEIMSALKSRVQTLCYDPTDEQIIALMEHIASHGHTTATGKATARECLGVKDYLIEQCVMAGLRPDVRMFVDKALKDFLLWKSNESETHWKDLVRSALEDRLTELKHASNIEIPSKTDEVEAELSCISKLLKQHSKDDAAKLFEAETGRGLRTFQRRLKVLKTREHAE